MKMEDLLLHIYKYAMKHGYCDVAIPVAESEERLISFVYCTDNSGYLDVYDFLLTDKEIKRTRPMTDRQLDEFVERFKVADALVHDYVDAKELQRYQLVNPEAMVYRTFPLRYREVDGVQCEKLVKYTDGQLVGFATADPDPFVEAYENNPGLRFAIEVIEEKINKM